MTDETATTRSITLGSTTFEIPMLPPIVNRKVFPLCRKLDALVQRTVAADGVFSPTEDEYGDVLAAVCAAVVWSTPDMTEEQFMNLPAAPQEHYAALLVVRLQTGGWTLRKPDDDREGEAKGAAA